MRRARAGAVAVAALALLGGEARAATAPPPVRGVGTPTQLSRSGRYADDPVAAVGATGRTVVGWGEASRPLGGPGSFRVRLGPAPGRLGRARDLGGTSVLDEVRLAVGPDGTALACWMHRGRLRCRAAGPGDRAFGRLQEIARWRRGARTTLTGLVVDGGGRAVLATRQRLGRNRYELRWTAGRPAALPALRRLVRTDGYDGGATLAAGPGPVTVAAWTVRAPGGDGFDRSGRVSVLSADAAAFAAPADPAVDGEPVSGVGLTAGPGGVIASYSRPVAVGAEPPSVTVRTVGDDGAFGPPQATLPAREGRGFIGFQDLAVPPVGGPLSVFTREDARPTDCDNTTFGELFAGKQRLSVPGQIVVDARVAALADGTALAAWVDESRTSSRMELAIRRPGAGRFGPGRPLPAGVSPETAFTLAAGGDHALLAWTTGRAEDGSDVVAAPLRRSAPIAPRARRPARPGTYCS